MDIIIVLLLIYLAVIETLSYLKIIPRVIFDRQIVVKEQKAEQKEEESHAAIITRPTAKRLKIITDPDKQKEHDAFMGTLDTNEVLGASRKATDPSQKGYTA